MVSALSETIICFTDALFTTARVGSWLIIRASYCAWVQGKISTQGLISSGGFVLPMSISQTPSSDSVESVLVLSSTLVSSLSGYAIVSFDSRDRMLAAQTPEYFVNHIKSLPI
ncbi:MAG: hypothetical protein ACOYIA_00495 [Eubacteriales bacterium]